MAPSTRYVKTIIWFCDNCNSQQYWVKKVTEQCLDCGHYRCAYCPVQEAKVPDYR